MDVLRQSDARAATMLKASGSLAGLLLAGLTIVAGFSDRPWPSGSGPERLTVVALLLAGALFAAFALRAAASAYQGRILVLGVGPKSVRWLAAGTVSVQEYGELLLPALASAIEQNERAVAFADGAMRTSVRWFLRSIAAAALSTGLMVLTVAFP
jgi:hypothetical protein